MDVKDLYLDPKIFDERKYTETRWNVLMRLDIPDVFISNIGMSGGSGAYASAYISIKKLIQKLESLETDLNDQFFGPLFMKAKKPSWTEEMIPIPKFDLTPLYELKTILDYMTKLNEVGAISKATLADPIGVSYKDEAAQKIREAAEEAASGLDKINTKTKDNNKPQAPISKPDALKVVNPVGKPHKSDKPSSEPAGLQPRPGNK
jgi:hypothetical protein